MKILYITADNPQEASNGSKQRTHLLWKALREISDVHTICIGKEDSSQLDEKITSLVIKRNSNSLISKLSIYEEIIANKCGLLNFGLFCSDARENLTKICHSIPFDLIVVRYINLIAKLRLWKLGPIYVDIDDDPIQKFENYKEQKLPFFFKSIIKWLLQKQLSTIEDNIVGAWIANLDGKWVNQIRTPLVELRNIPNIPSKKYQVESERYNYILTVGTMFYYPNYSGVDNFLSTIWPNFHEEYPDVEYIIVGKDAPIDYQNRWKVIRGVRYLGFVENLEELYQYCLATVVPIDSGSGTCIKTLESLAYSRICLSTRFGARGLDLTSDLCVYVYTDFSEFSKLFQEMVLNKKNRTKVEKYGLPFIMQQHSIDNFYTDVKKLLDYQNMCS